MLNFKNKYLQTKKKYVKQIGGNAFEEEDEVPLGFETEITHRGPIVALSDIHGDLHAFIISLRDCSEVIGKQNFNNNEIDPELEYYLNMDISREDGNYDETFGYQWIGGHTYVVICGDIIDLKRLDEHGREMLNCKKNLVFNNNQFTGTPCLQYPQIEIKILRFINAMNRLARREKGRIIKILGNHELENIDGSDIGFIRNYSFQTDHHDGYYRGYNRLNIFNVGNPGFALLSEDGCGFLIKINNTIFAHGQLPKAPTTIIDIIEDNNILNDPNITRSDFRRLYNTRYSNRTSNSPLWLKEWSYDDALHKRYTGKARTSQTDFCENTIIPTIQRFLNLDINNPDIDINNYRVVLGHCPQFYATAFNEISSTFDHLVGENDIVKIYDQQNLHTGRADVLDQNKIFGITMQCPKQGNDNFVYHVDIGSSRAFDDKTGHGNLNIVDNEGQNRYLFSRTPQVLYIDPILGDRIFIIKSKMKNTRIHLPRENYEIQHMSISDPLHINSEEYDNNSNNS